MFSITITSSLSAAECGVLQLRQPPKLGRSNEVATTSSQCATPGWHRNPAAQPRPLAGIRLASNLPLSLTRMTLPAPAAAPSPLGELSLLRSATKAGAATAGRSSTAEATILLQSRNGPPVKTAISKQRYTSFIAMPPFGSPARRQFALR
jgi:hypothetical protein